MLRNGDTFPAHATWVCGPLLRLQSGARVGLAARVPDECWHCGAAVFYASGATADQFYAGEHGICTSCNPPRIIAPFAPRMLCMSGVELYSGSACEARFCSVPSCRFWSLLGMGQALDVSTGVRRPGLWSDWPIDIALCGPLLDVLAGTLRSCEPWGHVPVAGRLAALRFSEPWGDLDVDPLLDEWYSDDYMPLSPAFEGVDDEDTADFGGVADGTGHVAPDGSCVSGSAWPGRLNTAHTHAEIADGSAEGSSFSQTFYPRLRNPSHASPSSSMSAPPSSPPTRAQLRREARHAAAATRRAEEQDDIDDVWEMWRVDAGAYMDGRMAGMNSDDAFDHACAFRVAQADMFHFFANRGGPDPVAARSRHSDSGSEDG